MNRERTIFVSVACLSFIIGLLIFFFAHGGFMRNYVGDVVAVTFLYSALRATLRPRPMATAAVVFVVAVGIEILQALVTLPHSTISALALGSTFDPLDILVYFVASLVLCSLDNGARYSSSASTP